MKKTIFSKVAAAVMAGAMVLGMAVTAFAADPLASGSVTDPKGGKPEEFIYVVDTKDLTDEQRSSIASMVCYFTVDSDFMNGGGGYNKDGATWTAFDQYEIKAAGDAEVTFPVENYALGGDGTDSLQVQVWWINPKADGTASGYTLNKVELKDASGNVIKTLPAADAPADDPADTPTGDSAATAAIILAAVAALAVAATVTVKKYAVER